MTGIKSEFTVLLVSPASSDILEEYVVSYTGCCFLTADSNADLLLKIGTSHFDLAILDEDFSSPDVMSLLKSLHGSVPLIAVMDGDGAEARQRLIAEGYDDCLVKPLTVQVLAEVIEFWSGTGGQDEFAMAITVLLDKFQQNRHQVSNLLNGLFEELPRQLDQLENAVQERDFDGAYQIAHKINGSAKVSALPSLGEAATRLELALREKNKTIEEDFQQLKSRVNKLISRREHLSRQLEA